MSKDTLAGVPARGANSLASRVFFRVSNPSKGVKVLLVPSENVMAMQVSLKWLTIFEKNGKEYIVSSSCEKALESLPHWLEVKAGCAINPAYLEAIEMMERSDEGHQWQAVVVSKQVRHLFGLSRRVAVAVKSGLTIISTPKRGEHGFYDVDKSAGHLAKRAARLGRAETKNSSARSASH